MGESGRTFAAGKTRAGNANGRRKSRKNASPDSGMWRFSCAVLSFPFYEMIWNANLAERRFSERPRIPPRTFLRLYVFPDGIFYSFQFDGKDAFRGRRSLLNISVWDWGSCGWDYFVCVCVNWNWLFAVSLVDSVYWSIDPRRDRCTIFG